MGSPVITAEGWINPIPRIDTYFFRNYSNTDLPSFCKLPSKILIVLPSWLHALPNSKIKSPWIYYVKGINCEVPHCGAFSTPHSHPFWVQIYTSSSFQIPLACFPPLMWHFKFFYLNPFIFFLFFPSFGINWKNEHVISSIWLPISGRNSLGTSHNCPGSMPIGPISWVFTWCLWIH